MEAVENVHLVLSRERRSLMINGIEFADKVCEIGIHTSGIVIPTVTLTFPFTALEADVDGEIAARLELPPHGRLIDADALANKIRELMGSPSNLANAQFFINTLREAPTVIRAEEGE